MAIDLRGVTVNRGGRAILDDVTWSVPAGGIVAVLGHNGSGKSTLARVVMGHIWPATGTVAVLGRAFGETDLNHLRQSIRLVQSAGGVTFHQDQSLIEVVLTGFFGTFDLYDPVTVQMRDRVEETINRVGIRADPNAPFATLSGGERVRCLIARAVLVMPELLILDEITAGLDILAREQVLATVDRLTGGAGQPTVLMITHHLEELLPRTSSVLLLRNGRTVATGRPDQILTGPNLSTAYDFPVTVDLRDGRYWLTVKADDWGLLL